MKYAIGIAAAFALVIAIVVGGSAISWYNSANSAEIGVKTQFRQNQNNYDKFWKSVKEQAQVADHYSERFAETLIGAVEGRYDGDGTGALMKLVMEANPALSDDTFEQVQRTIEAGRIDFEKNQKALLDRQRAYETQLTSFFGRIYAGLFGFPRELTGDYAPPTDADGDGLLTALDYPIVTSARTKKAFATGEDEALDVFGK